MALIVRPVDGMLPSMAPAPRLTILVANDPPWLATFARATSAAVATTVRIR